MESLFKIFKTLILIIWLIDIMDINLIINNFQLAQFLDETLAINGWFWFWLWCLIPGVEKDAIKVTLKKKLEEDDD